MKKIIFLLIFVLLLSSLPISVFADDKAHFIGDIQTEYVINTSDTRSQVVDKDNMLSVTEKLNLYNLLASVEQKTGVAVCAYVYKGTGDYNYYDYKREYSPGSDFVLLIIRYDYRDGEYYYYLDTYGEPETLITDKEVDRLLDDKDVYDNIKSGKLADGIKAYALLADKALTGNLRPPLLKIVLIALGIGVATSAVVCLGVYLFYRRKQHSPSYPLERYANLKLNVSRDTFITKTVTRVKINTSSSSSGGRSGGGGGGHRGGR